MGRWNLTKTWWGDAWCDAIDAAFWDHVLSASRKIVKNNGVKKLKIVDSSVSAKVKGYHKNYYDTMIGFEDFGEENIKIILETIRNDPLILSALLNHELPEELYFKLMEKDIAVFPFSFSNLSTYCDCNEWVDFCKHKAALLYQLSVEIDKDPFLIFKLQGCDLLKLLNFTEEINEIREADELFEIEEGQNFKNTQIDFSKIPNLYDEIFFLLDDSPIFFEDDFKKILDKIYKALPGFLKKDVGSYTRQNKDKTYNYRIDLGERKKKFQGKDENYEKWLEDYFQKRWNMPNSWSKFKVSLNKDYEISNISAGFKTKDFTPEFLFNFFCELSESQITKFNPDIQFMNLIYQFAVELIKKQAFIPELFKSSNNVHIRWIPATFDKNITSLVDSLSEKCPENLLKFKNKKAIPKSQVISLVSLFIKGFLNIYFDKKAPKNMKNHFDKDIFKLFFADGMKMEDNDSLITSINNWLSKFDITTNNQNLYFVIEEIRDSFKLEIKVGDDLKNINEVISKTKDYNLKKQLLKDVHIITDIFPEFKKSFKDNKDIILDLDEFSQFFLNTLPLFEIIGITVVLPKHINNAYKPTIALNINSVQSTNKYISFEDISDFNWEIQIGDYTCSFDEFEKLAENSKGFVKIRDEYVLLDKKEVKSLLKRMKKLPKKLNEHELIKAMLAGEYRQAKVNIDDTLKSLISDFTDFSQIEVPQSVNANLRHYQEIGFSWLVQNMKMGFGSILADDMGLGKTLEVLTAIQYFKDENLIENGSILIIAPTGLLTNWQKEIEKFTPSLTSYIYHGSKRAFPDEEFDIYLTSYGIVRSDIDVIKKKKWFLLIVDEAQNIKNPNTIQTMAIKSIKSKNKIAMSGTPIENRLSDYWSIFDFINKGYLTNLRKFKKEFIIPIERERNVEVLEDFKKITSPFILRRVKSDTTIIGDLPEKIVNDVYCNMSEKQIALYKDTLDLSIDNIMDNDGIQRKGLVLKLINSLKQICNHPSQFKKSDEYAVEESGKLKTLIDTVDNILDSNEKVLIFTQYSKMGEIIKNSIEKTFDCDVLFLHGSVKRERRDKMIEEFQTNSQIKVFVITLKTGGTGLNLTAASNVIHYDLWWNPAVENQATDRAYRIGQNSNVMVYRFITYGTFEEKINDMIFEKNELANLAVGNDETFITEMSDDDLRELMTLRYFS